MRRDSKERDGVRKTAELCYTLAWTLVHLLRHVHPAIERWQEHEQREESLSTDCGKERHKDKVEAMAISRWAIGWENHTESRTDAIKPSVTSLPIVA